MKKKTLQQKIIQLLQKRHRKHGRMLIERVAKILGTSKTRTAKTIFRMFNENKLEIYAEFVELKSKKPHKK